MTTRTTALAAAAAGLTLLLWSSAFVAVRHLGGFVSPGVLSLGRLLVGGLALLALLLTRNRHRLTRREAGLLLVCGLSWFGAYNLALNESERRIDAATTAMLIQLGPLLLALLAAVFLGERLTTWLLVGMGVGFAGVVVIGLALGKGGAHDLVGVLLAVLAAATYAVGVLTQKLLLARLSALEVVCYSTLIGAVCCLPWAGELVRTASHADAKTVLLVVYLGLFPTALAFSTWAFALAHMQASRLTVSTFLVPVLTAVLAWWLLGEVPPAAAFVGGALCIAGVLITRRRPRVVPVEEAEPAVSHP